MAAAAYAALVSLMNVLTRYQHPTCPVSFDQSQIQTLLDKVTSLVDFLENYYTRSIQDLERKMTSAAHAAEDTIESSYVKRVIASDEGDINVGYTPDDILQKSIQEMDLIIKEANYSVNKEKKDEKDDMQETYSTKRRKMKANNASVQGFSANSPSSFPKAMKSLTGFGPNLNNNSVSISENVMVGFDEQLSFLMDQIRMYSRSRVIIPIVGMSGIGKTTLATNVYNHSYVVRHFQIRAWVTISQRYVVKDVIVALLREIKAGGNDLMNTEQLGNRLHKSLWCRKYLIVIDDIWSSQALYEIRRFFPDNANGSIILLTSSLESKMISAAHTAEDTIESYYVKRMIAREAAEADINVLYPDLQKAIQEMDLIFKEANYFDMQETSSIKRRKMKANDGSVEVLISNSPSSLPKDMNSMVGFAPNLSEIANTNSSVSVSSLLPPRGKNVMVGFDDQLSSLMDWIRAHNRSLAIIPIVGVGGIGKTTLATNVYNHSYVGRHFDIRAWVTISQRYVVNDVIVALLREIKAGGNDQMNNKQLGDRLNKSLWGRKYLIVIDDIWSSEAWDEIKLFFPDNANGSRIMLTTRLWSVADSVGSSSIYKMQFLDYDKSLNLLSETVYGLQAFPAELATLGKAIAKSCKGLPLVIVVIGGLLKMSPKTLEYWANVAINVSSIVSTENDGHCLEILSLSYNHLPIHLKPCFLYMATFKEDEQIDIPGLIKLWVADGLLKPRKDGTLEEVALEYLNDLIGRHLLMAGAKNEIGKLIGCRVHDLLREFCLRKAQNENFLCVIEEEDTCILPQRLDSQRRLVYNFSNYKSRSLFPPVPNARSLYFGRYSEDLVDLTSDHALLRVLHIHRGEYTTPLDFAPLFNIRHLECLSTNSLSLVPDSLLSLSLFWNLETLILNDPDCSGRLIYLPCDIWGFPNLRHLELMFVAVFPDPVSGNPNCVLNNLQTISTYGNFYYTDEAGILIPNLKELSFVYNTSVHVVEDPKLSHSFNNLALLDKLEKLSVSFVSFSFSPGGTFSPNLRELELEGCGIPWDNITIIGSLPNLEMLKLSLNAFCGEEWNSIEGEFKRLKYLAIFRCHLGIWRADSYHFPRLEHLVLSELGLKEIPQGIGEVLSLESIELYTRDMSLVISAKKILDERQNHGYDDLLIKGVYWGISNEEKAELEKRADADYNFQIVFHVSSSECSDGNNFYTDL